jgi:nucleoside-diphosphate-sugar epimerase
MRALVTGAAGFIGSHLCEALLERGAEVTGLDCFTDYYPRAIKESNLSALTGRRGFHLIQGSLQGADMGALLEGKTHVYHLAAQAGVRTSWGRDFESYTSHNVNGTQRLLEAAKGRDLHRFVYASSSSVYGDLVSIPMREASILQPVSPYGVTKLAAEHLCHLYFANYGLPAVCLRYFTVYGPRQRPDMGFHRFLRAALTGQAIEIYGDGEQTRDFTYVGDAVAATIAAGDQGQPGSVYNIGGGSRVSINQVLALVEKVTGRPIQRHHEAPQKGDMRDTFADTSRARTDLGFSPSKSLESGLTAECEWLSRLLAVSQR